ncbi:hypothetical protein GCK72_021841 [Caenorhabditis remanei]|nr:hypothetical protein GCK72_021841 [Caenorhabditis remanei]KAF1755272.1 hypothetical protein GCK72_021841 [Caenorhabditis remanei]
MDEETKIRMIFALSAPIDSGFLVKIKESDDVQTDHARRTTEYTTKEGGFELKGTYLWPHCLSQEREKRTLEFLARKSMTTDLTAFITDFQNYTQTSVSLLTLEQDIGPSKDICIRLPATTPVPQTPKNQRTGQTPIKTTKE